MKLLFAVILTLVPMHVLAQECLHGPDSTPEQRSRRSAAIGAARTINNLQANRPNRKGAYLDLAELADSYATETRLRSTKTPLNFAPGEDLLSGWQLSFQKGEKGYWFMIRDVTDPCGFALISSEAGLIYRAEPLR